MSDTEWIKIVEEGRTRWAQIEDLPLPPLPDNATPKDVVSSTSAEPLMGSAENVSASQPTAAQAWEVVRAQLEGARALKREARRAEEDAFSALDRFLAEHGEEGRALAGNYPQLVEDERDVNRRRQEYVDNRRKRRAAEVAKAAQQQAVEDATRLVEGLNQAYEDRRQNGTLHRAPTLLEDLRLARLKLAMLRGVKAPQCFVCGLLGVERGRECPNTRNHGQILRLARQAAGKKTLG